MIVIPASVKKHPFWGEPSPCKRAAETPLQALSLCFVELICPRAFFSEGVLYSQTPVWGIDCWPPHPHPKGTYWTPWTFCNELNGRPWLSLAVRLGVKRLALMIVAVGGLFLPLAERKLTLLTACARGGGGGVRCWRGPRTLKPVAALRGHSERQRAYRPMGKKRAHRIWKPDPSCQGQLLVSTTIISSSLMIIVIVIIICLYIYIYIYTYTHIWIYREGERYAAVERMAMSCHHIVLPLLRSERTQRKTLRQVSTGKFIG